MTLDARDWFRAIGAAILSDVIGMIERDLTKLRFLCQDDHFRRLLSVLRRNARVDPGRTRQAESRLIRVAKIVKTFMITSISELATDSNGLTRIRERMCFLF